MAERIPVLVRGQDAITETGVRGQLRQRDEVLLVDAVDPDEPPVVIVVADAADDGALSMVREQRGQGARQVVLVLAAVDDVALMTAVEAGVCGIIARSDASPERLVGAVQQAAAMGGVLSPALVGRLLGQVTRLQTHVLAPRGLRLTGLSAREADVLRLIAQGWEVREIAQKLAYSERTIKNTLHDVLNRFQLRNRSHAVAFAIREGMI